jgi:hypothetical protein
LTQTEALPRALDVCIENLLAGQTLEETLETYPQLTSELNPLLEAVQTLLVYRALLEKSFAVDDAVRVHFLETAKHLQQEARQKAKSRRRWTGLGWTALIFSLSAILLWVIIMTSIALPGETYYPLKELFWQARLQVTQAPQSRLLLERKFDRLRLDEILELISINRGAPVAFAGPLTQVQGDAWSLAGLSIRVTPQTQIFGKIRDNTWVEVTGELLPERTINASTIRPREYSITGELQQVSADTLVISDILFKINSDTLVHGSPMVGSQVHAVALQNLDGTLLARFIETQD